jgi:hypothetical protein
MPVLAGLMPPKSGSMGLSLSRRIKITDVSVTLVEEQVIFF